MWVDGLATRSNPMAVFGLRSVQLSQYRADQHIYRYIIYRHSQQSHDGASIDLDKKPTVLRKWARCGRKGRDLLKVPCWDFFAGEEKNHKNLCRYCRCPDRDSKWTSLE